MTSAVNLERSLLPSLVVPAGAGIRSTVVESLVDTLWNLGVRQAFGIMGGAVAPFCEAVNRSPIELLHCRHEGGAAFAAIEASLASGRLTVVFSTSGPGITNSITGMMAARWEGAKVLFISGTTGSRERGRWAFQETSSYTMPVAGLFTAGPIFHLASLVDSALELESLSARIAVGLSRPGGFVAHLGLPISVQTATAPETPRPRFSSFGPPSCDDNVIDECVSVLASEPFVIWLGYGARKSARAIRALVDASGAKVMCSPRAKGIFPEDDPRFLGVTGLGGHAAVLEHMREARPARTLVLGSRLGEFTSYWNDELVPREGFVHVDIDPEVFCAAYPSAQTLSVQADIGTFVDALLARWPKRRPRPQIVPPFDESQTARLVPRTDKPLVRPKFLMEAIQETVVEGSDAIVLTEAGNSFTLGSHHLRFNAPGRYRVSAGFGSMGHAVGGVLGAAIGSGQKAVAIAGDGAMLMLNEINTAVAYGIDAVWIVLNDARYGMIEEGMKAVQWTPFACDIPRSDFVAIARAMGADGVRVETEAQLGEALAAAMRASGPFVVDVRMDPTEVGAPNGRNSSLKKQGFKPMAGVTT